MGRIKVSPSGNSLKANKRAKMPGTVIDTETIHHDTEIMALMGNPRILHRSLEPQCPKDIHNVFLCPRNAE